MTDTASIKYGVSLYSYTGEYGVTMTLDDCVEDVAGHRRHRPGDSGRGARA
jgi:hypothetical protein